MVLSNLTEEEKQTVKAALETALFVGQMVLPSYTGQAAINKRRELALIRNILTKK